MSFSEAVKAPPKVKPQPQPVIIEEIKEEQVEEEKIDESQICLAVKKKRTLSKPKKSSSGLDM